MIGQRGSRRTGRGAGLSQATTRSLPLHKYGNHCFGTTDRSVKGVPPSLREGERARRDAPRGVFTAGGSCRALLERSGRLGPGGHTEPARPGTQRNYGVNALANKGSGGSADGSSIGRPTELLTRSMTWVILSR